MGGDNDLPGAARRAAAPEGLERRGRAAQRLAGRRDAPRGESRPTQRQTGGHRQRRRVQRGADIIVATRTYSPFRRIVRRDALPDRPQAVGRACADVLSRCTAKIAGPSAQRGPDRRAIPVGACRRQRAPIFNRAQFGGVAGAASPCGRGTDGPSAGRQGKALSPCSSVACAQPDSCGNSNDMGQFTKRRCNLFLLCSIVVGT